MRVILLFALTLLASSIVQAQVVTDDVKHSFDETQPIKIDVDGDGKADTIRPRTYAIVPNCAKGQPLKFIDIQHWIAFDLTLSTGRRMRSFFKYNYGSSEASYWVYALISAGDINRDGRTDLIFYSGDDTSDETITLINKGNHFVVHSKKHGESMARHVP
jgi:hypothetical protein